MPLSDSMRQTLDELRAQEKKLVEDLSGLRFTIKNLERLAGLESQEVTKTEAPPDFNSTAKEVVGAAGNGTVGKPTIRPDEFFGLTHAEAARRYLKRVGFAVSFGELVDVLRKGGCKLTSADPERVLWISLVKNSKDFVPPQPGFVGLRDFYPTRARAVAEQKHRTKQAKRSGARKVGTKSAKPKPNGKYASPKPVAPPHGNTAAKSTAEGKPIPLAVHEFMSDRQFHRLEEVVGAVRKKLGENVLPLSVRGALSSKKTFEQNQEGMYRLINQ